MAPNSHASNPPTTAAPPAPSRARPQGSRRKVNHAADDAAYHGVISSNSLAGAKRTAGDKVDGEPRLKRKRLEPVATPASAVPSALGANFGRKPSAAMQDGDREARPSLIDFTTLPIDAIHRYLTQFDIVPDIEPLATTAFDPPPPSSLLRPRGQRTSTASPAPPQPLPPTPANRPRREPSASANRRRSSRLLEDDRMPLVTPVLADVHEVHRTLAQVVEKHFREHSVKEVDTLASFMCAVKAKARTRV